MAAKAEILRELQESELLVPERLHEALDANARAKYYLSLLQMAQAHAEAPEIQADLREDRERSGIEDAYLDDVVSSSRWGSDDDYRIPSVGSIVSSVLADVDRMIAPLREARAGSVASFEARLRDLSRRAAVGASTASRAALAALTSSERSAGDSLHLLVMDVHKELYDLESRVAPESVQGARVYGISGEDRPLVAAFERGLQQTAKLKFQHPGLTTTATRSGARLLIENDIGETAAHVLVLRVEGLRIEIVHTDVHLQRLRFFQGLFARFPVTWSDTNARAGRGLGTDLFYECVGTLAAADARQLEEFLQWVGSRLVFLIDWNRARKQLRAFVAKEEALALLDRAAADEVGHRGFLEMGGERLVYDAMAAVVRTPMRFGERLDDVLGRDGATSFLQLVLRVTAEGLLAGKSRSLIAEQVRAELASAYLAGGDRLLGPVIEHAGIVAELAAALRDALDRPSAERAEIARAAKERESQADQLVGELRSVVSRMPGHAAFRRMIEAADNAADGLEEASFLLALAPEGAQLGEAYDAALRQLVGYLVAASEAYVTSLQAARHARSGADRAATYALLEAVERVVTMEHETDRAEREAVAGLVRGAVSDGRTVLLAAHLASEVEDAADALMHAAYVLRDHTMEEDPLGPG